MNYVAFSNRAMAYLKVKEYHRAEVRVHGIACKVYICMCTSLYIYQYSANTHLIRITHIHLIYIDGLQLRYRHRPHPHKIIPAPSQSPECTV